jgi:5'-3' exonuclease
VQVPVIVEVLDALGLAIVGADEHEADDVIGTLATGAGMPVDIVTGDRDLFQLVDDDQQVRVLYTARGMSNLDSIDAAAVRSRYGIQPGQYADFATLRGDSSDGLPGVAGIGDKTAASLLQQFGDLDGVIAAASDLRNGLTPAQRKRIAAGADYLKVAPTVVAVVRDLDLDLPDLRLPAPVPAVPDAFESLVERWGLGGSAERVVAALADAG